MRPTAVRSWALFCLTLVVQFPVSHGFAVGRRENSLVPPTTPIPSLPPPKETNSVGNNADGKDTKESGSKSTEIGSTHIPSSTQRPTSTPMPTLASDGPLVNSSFFNATIPPGELPLPPQLTPGWGVGGVIMLVSGLIYALVGIKNRWIHTFFSTAYVTALGVSVLIVYVMNVPVSNALQGGYVVAVVMSGCAVGAAAMFFKELTEGFGCALGGFCMSMWLLCLVPGGLLHSIPSKAIFIASFTAGGFAFYFSKWTRDWALIAMISFGGATITVLGIDCFSRAGLKEFWAYVWNINDNLFPLGAVTYPVTKGIRVETAAVIIIFLIGIISQIKLWRIVREKRDKRAAERAEDQRNLEKEEENVGREIEKSNARERRQWERVHGDGTSDSITESRVTDFGDTGSEIRLRSSYVGSKGLSGEVIEMADLSESDQSRNEPEALMATADAKEGKVTVRVAVDDVPESMTEVGEEQLDEKAASRLEANTPTDGEIHSKGTTGSKRASQAPTATESPQVVPLPFTVPQEDDAKSDGDRSSVATFADDNEAVAEVPRKHKSLAKRLSRGSATMLRNFSQRSGRGDMSPGSSDSTEELVLEKTHRADDDGRSLAATVDNESVSRGDAHSIFDEVESHNDDENDGNNRRSIEINAQLGKKDDTVRQSALATDSLAEDHQSSPEAACRPEAVQKKTSKESIESGATSPRPDEKVAEPSREPSAHLGPPETSQQGKSIATVSSIPVSLSKDRLPKPLSRVAMSYRTNEWAKHLSNAECPEPDELQMSAAKAPKVTKDAREKAIPVNVEDLQKTAEDGTPAPAMRRTTSPASEAENMPYAKRYSLKEDLTPSPAVASSPSTPVVDTAQQSTGLPLGPPAVPVRKISSSLRQQHTGIQHIVEDDSLQRLNTVAVAMKEETVEQRQALADSPTIAIENAPIIATSRTPTPGVVSYASPQTLIGQREMFLRSKSQGSLLLNTPEPTYANARLSSDAESLYNYPMYAAALNIPDPDDVPLSQRKEYMRQSSLLSLSSSPSQPMVGIGGRSVSGFESSENITFNSHQPNRASNLPTLAAREAQLANFRQSVQHELRSGTPIMTTPGRETPFRSSALLSGGREAEVQRNIEMQRNVMMGQKEAEAQRKEIQRREREYVDRAFDERMRNGDMLEAHREAMRKMQKGAR